MGVSSQLKMGVWTPWTQSHFLQPASENKNLTQEILQSINCYVGFPTQSPSINLTTSADEYVSIMDTKPQAQKRRSSSKPPFNIHRNSLNCAKITPSELQDLMERMIHQTFHPLPNAVADPDKSSAQSAVASALWYNNIDDILHYLRTTSVKDTHHYKWMRVPEGPNIL